MHLDELEKKEADLLTVNRYEVEENAVFLDYTPQSLIQQIKDYSNIKYHIRLSLSKNLSTVHESLISNQNNQIFYQLVEAESKDIEEIQGQLIKFLASKIKQHSIPTDYKNLLIVPLTNMIKGSYLQVKQNSCSLISKVAHQLELQEKTNLIKLAVELGENENEENKIVSLQLLAKMAQDMPDERKEHLFKEQFMNLFKNSSVRIKRQVILELGELVQYLSQEFVDNEVIEQFYSLQCLDNAWGIRKACVQIITPMLRRSSAKKAQLSQKLLNFTKDGNKFVRVLAYKSIPQFLANYGNEEVPEKFINLYSTLIDHEVNNQTSKQHQIIHKISFYFPGVLYTLGPSKWSSLKKLFDRLLHFKSEQIKMPIASSLHEIAKVIGPQQSKQYLFLALDTILKQQSDTLKLAAIRNLGKFVELFEKATRQNLIDVFLVLQKDPKKWRVRYSISYQIDYLSKIYDPETIFKYIFPISLKLCNDNVSEVRHQAAKKIVYVIQNMKTDQNLYFMAIQSIKGYALSEKFIQRQTFALMLDTLYEKIDDFFDKFINEINLLSEDKICVVRISLAISIEKILKKGEKEEKMFENVVKKLRQDEQVGEYLEERIKEQETENLQ